MKLVSLHSISVRSKVDLLQVCFRSVLPDHTAQKQQERRTEQQTRTRYQILCHSNNK